MVNGDILKIEGLARQFGGVHAVEGVNLSVMQGRITGIIGPNGAGKTTLFNIISGALAPDRGRIVFGGRDIGAVPVHQRHAMGIVRTFQIPREFGRLTTLENLMVMAPGQSGERWWRNWLTPRKCRADEVATVTKARTTLDSLGLSAQANMLAATLSGGQKKLLEIARAMMCTPSLVLLDEPGAGINPSFMNKIAAAIRTLNTQHGITFCIIEHDMNVIVTLCDHVVVMHDGGILTQGRMDEIRNDPRVIEAYLGAGDGD